MWPCKGLQCSVVHVIRNLYALWCEVSYLGDMTNEEHDNNDTHNAHGAFAGVAMWNFPMEHHKCAN